MNEYRLSIWTGKRRADRVANILRQAGIRVESVEEREVIVAQRAARPTEAVAAVRVELVRHYRTHFDLHPVVLDADLEPASS